MTLYNKFTVDCSNCGITYRLHTMYDVPVKGQPIYCCYCGSANDTQLDRNDTDSTWQEAVCEEFGQPWSVLQALYEVWLETGLSGTSFHSYLNNIFKR